MTVNIGDWCENTYYYWPDGTQIRGASLILMVLGITAFLSFVGLLIFLFIQERRANRSGFSEGKTSTLIFPLYNRILCMSALVTLADACGDLIAPTHRDKDDQNTFVNSTLYGGVWGLYHFVFEGIAFLMLNDGVGKRAAKRSGLFAFIWAAFTWVVQSWVTYRSQSDVAIGMAVLWAALLVCFYGCLWLLPLSVLFRRPCLFNYARFWCLMRLWLCISNLLSHYGIQFGFCMYLFGMAAFQSPAVAFIVYHCLRSDCQYWLGVLSWEARTWNMPRSSTFLNRKDAVLSSANPNGTETLRRPLLGTTLPPHSARALASQMDSNKHSLLSPANQTLRSSASTMGASGVKILNFAFLKIDQPSATPHLAVGGVQQVILGSGSSSRVFQGTFRAKPVAIKMIFVPDLTPDIISSFYHEATLLAQLSHVNVVEVLGICVLPPAICLVMELCEGGNLYDYLRSPPLQAQPLTLWKQLSMTYDCCSAVQFLHTHEPAILHLDLKSLNFLLKKDGRIKVADLELSREIVRMKKGSDKSERKSHRSDDSVEEEDENSNDVIQGSELTGFKIPETLYWLAPEIILGEPYNEKADIYALGLVIWEIFTSSVPFRSLEDSLILAARNVKYLEALGYEPGSYPQLGLNHAGVGVGTNGMTSSGSLTHLPYILNGHVPPRFASQDEEWNGSQGGSARHSRKNSMRGRSSSDVSDTPAAGSGSIYHIRHLNTSSNSLLPAAASSNPPTPQSRSHVRTPKVRSTSTSSNRRYEQGEEEEMSTPSSSASGSEAPSPNPQSQMPFTNRVYPVTSSNSTNLTVSGSPPPLSNIPANLHAPTPVHLTPSSSMLTHENLAVLSQATNGSSSSATYTQPPVTEVAIPASSSTTTHASGASSMASPSPVVVLSSPAHLTDPILIEWTRMHKQLHEHGQHIMHISAPPGLGVTTSAAAAAAASSSSATRMMVKQGSSSTLQALTSTPVLTSTSSSSHHPPPQQQLHQQPQHPLSHSIQHEHTSFSSMIPPSKRAGAHGQPYTRPTLPPIPASVGSASSYDGSSGGINSIPPITLGAIESSDDVHEQHPHSHSDETHHLGEIEQHVYVDLHQPQQQHQFAGHTTSAGYPRISRDDGVLDIPIDIKDSRMQQVRSAPFLSDPSPIMAASAAESMSVFPPDSSSMFVQPTSLVATHTIQNRQRTESYVQYAPDVIPDVPTPTQQLYPDDSEQLWQGEEEHGTMSGGTSYHHNNGASYLAPEPVRHYPSTMPASRSILVDTIQGKSEFGTSNNNTGNSNSLKGSEPTSIPSSPAPSHHSYTSNASTASNARIPRVSRVKLEARGGKSSRKKRSAHAHAPTTKSSRPTVDFNSIYVSRHEVQSQLRHLICVGHYRPTIPPDMPDALSLLLTRAWHPVPHMRPTATEFVQTIAVTMDQLKQQGRTNIPTSQYASSQDQYEESKSSMR